MLLRKQYIYAALSAFAISLNVAFSASLTGTPPPKSGKNPMLRRNQTTPKHLISLSALPSIAP